MQHSSREEFPTLGIAADVKIPTHVRLTKSNSPGLPDPPILGQTIDRCITPHPRSPRRGISAEKRVRGIELKQYAFFDCLRGNLLYMGVGEQIREKKNVIIG